MAPPISRRALIAAGTGLAAAAMTGCSDGNDRRAPPVSFLHGVASGDPLQDRVILWTRLSDAVEAAVVEWVVATDPALSSVVRASGDGFDEQPMAATPEADFTFKLDVSGLQPGTTYYYQFRVDGARSPVGRTRTAPQDAPRLRFAVASCAKYHQAYWHAYRHIAARADLDLVLHCGDYLYEEDDRGSAVPGRELDENVEVYTLGQYRRRYALFRSDPDLQELHRQHPMVAVWDDHELADNCWYGGAHRHDEATQGPWAERRAAAVRSYAEWMPVREQPTPAGKNRYERIYRSFSYGTLADVIAIDTRVIGRDREVTGLNSDEPALPDMSAVNDPGRSLLGQAQREWFLDALGAARGQWKVVVNQVMLGQLHLSPALKADGGGIPLNTDQWDGYRADQNRVIAHLRDNGIDDVVFVTGDIHTSWANDITDDPHNPGVYLREDPGVPGALPPPGQRGVAVEFVTPGIGSRAGAVGNLAANVQDTHPHVRYVEGESRGYFLLDLDRERAQAEWTYVESPEAPQSGFREGGAWMTRSGNNHLEPAAQVSPPGVFRPPAP